MALTVGSSVASNLSTVIATALLVRSLGTETFGRVAFISTAASALSSFATAGLALYIIRSISMVTHHPETERTSAAEVTAASLCGQLIAACIAALLILYGYWVQRDLGPGGFALAALALPFITADALAKNKLIGHQHIGALSLVTVLGTLILVGMQLAGALAFGPLGYLVGFLLGSVFQCGCSQLACRVTISTVQPRPTWQELRDSLSSKAFKSFVVPATLAASMVPVAHWCANLIAVNKAARYSDVAILTVAMQFFNMVVFLPTVLNKIILPWTIRKYSTSDSADNKAHTRRQALLTFLLTCPAPLVLWLLSGPISSLYRFSDASSMHVVYCFVAAGILASTSIAISNYLVSSEKMALGLTINALWTVTYLGLALLMPGGAIAVGWGLMLAYAASLGLALYLLATHRSHDGSQ
ncbi:hypothetical protein [Roseateles toxinivorans]|uniref:O-antigen/teichoic acid export membrane protein n=1 Tax=Roseateles toxinivorans TaxID=270368 RepID=A0A4R6QMR6_9BURK|nr:hypothetical protein [Roseateles toxinivorans]TDP71436.1 O-antigen/teichoic acid export membrane protein [Roseateles toxinivorans]